MKGKAMPPMITTPGGGSWDASGSSPDWDAPEKAANSAMSDDVLTTPTPPTTEPFLKSGMPPGLTLAGSLSVVSVLPVMMPNPRLRPSIERAGSMSLPGRKVAFSGHPRLVFSIPYKSPLGAFVTPGGKWIPLMKRTVRVESGAWLLLKKAAVRASATASSLLSTATPKLPAEVVGAPAF